MMRRDDGCAIAAFVFPAAIVDQDAVEAGLVIRFREQATEALDEAGFEGGGDVARAPDLGCAFGCVGFVLLGKQCRGDGGFADRGFRFAAVEERLDLACRAAGHEELFFGALLHQVAVRPIRVGLDEGPDLARGADAVAIEVPIDQFAGDRIGDLVTQGFGLCDIGDGADGIANADGIVDRGRDVADRRDHGIEAGDAFGFGGGRLRRGDGRRFRLVCRRRARGRVRLSDVGWWCRWWCDRRRRQLHRWRCHRFVERGGRRHGVCRNRETARQLVGAGWLRAELRQVPAKPSRHRRPEWTQSKG